MTKNDLDLEKADWKELPPLDEETKKVLQKILSLGIRL